MAGRFDWYQATVAASPAVVLQALEAGFSGRSGVQWEDLAKAPQGYGFGRRLHDADGAVAAVWWGGQHERPHVVGSGESAQAVAEVLRAEFPDGHRVARADACLDFAAPGAYELIEREALRVAGEQRITVGTAGDHLLTKQGRTVYLGASSSHTRARVYEKGHELRAKFRHQPERWQCVPEHLARLEIQVRPKTPQAREAASHVAPLVLMGSTAWTRELIRAVCSFELEPFEAGRAWRQRDDDRAYAALLAQYGGLLQRLKEDHGTWDLLGRQIGDDLARRARPR